MTAKFFCPRQKSNNGRGGFSFLAIIILCTLPYVASAANINVLDLTDTLGIAASQFEGGFTSTINNPTEMIMFQGSWISNGGTTGSGVVYFVEPTSPTRVSDILLVSFTCASTTGCTAGIMGTFMSDVTGDLGPLPAGFTGVPETGALQGVNGLLQNPANGASVTLPANLTIFVQSNATETPEVPEPSSVYLVTGGIALVAASFVRRRGVCPRT